MQSQKLISALVCVAVLAVVAVSMQAQPNVARTQDHPDFDDRTPGDWSTRAPSGLTVLSWDDGTYETGLGVSGAAGYDGVVGQRFGGSPATSGVVPLGIRGAYWRMFGGFAGATQVRINFWHPLAGGFPANPTPIAGVAGNTNTASTQFASTAGGPTISTANGSVIAGVNVLGVSSWFVAADNTGPFAGRGVFAGSSGNINAPPTVGFSTIGFIANPLIRLLVDGNVPVELETFSVESVE